MPEGGVQVHMRESVTTTFSAAIWIYPGKGGWHFVTLPQSIAARVRFLASPGGRGWSSQPVSATVGNTRWRTSIFPDTTSGSFLLPLKSDVRKREGLTAGKTIEVTLEFA